MINRRTVPGSDYQYSGWTTEANHLGNVPYRLELLQNEQ